MAMKDTRSKIRVFKNATDGDKTIPSDGSAETLKIDTTNLNSLTYYVSSLKVDDFPYKIAKVMESDSSDMSGANEVSVGKFTATYGDTLYIGQDAFDLFRQDLNELNVLKNLSIRDTKRWVKLYYTGEGGVAKVNFNSYAVLFYKTLPSVLPDESGQE